MTGTIQEKLQTKLRAKLYQRVKSLTGRFARQKDGAAAVEFALVAAPFLAMVFAIMETAIIFFASQALETSAADGARLILTGQAQTQGFNQAAFKNAVCAKIYGLFDCGGLIVDVKNYASFASIDTSKPITNGVANLNAGYAPGGKGDIVIVRLMYQWPVYVSLLGLNLADNGSNRLLMATVAFRNEPF